MKSVSLIAFIAGLATGGAVALLLAPKSGKETRRKMKEAAEEVADKFERMKEKAEHCAHEQMRHSQSTMNEETQQEQRIKKPSPVI